MRKAFRYAVLPLIYLFMLAPILAVAMASFNGQAVLSFPPRSITLASYLNIQPSFWQALKVSLSVAAITTIVSTAVALPAAVAIGRGNFAGRDAVSAFFLSPLMIPTLVLGIAIYQFNGLLWDHVGLSLTRSRTGLVFGHLTFAIPFVMRGILAGSSGYDMTLEHAAQNLGATRWQTIRYVTLPLIRPGIASGAIFAFMMSLDDVPIALFLGGTSDSTTLPIKILNAVEFDFRGDVMAVSTTIVVATFLVCLIFDRIVGLSRLFGAS